MASLPHLLTHAGSQWAGKTGVRRVHDLAGPHLFQSVLVLILTDRGSGEEETREREYVPQIPKYCQSRAEKGEAIGGSVD